MKISLRRLFFMGIAVGAGMEFGRILPLVGTRAISKKVREEMKAQYNWSKAGRPVKGVPDTRQEEQS